MPQGAFDVLSTDEGQIRQGVDEDGPAHIVLQTVVAAGTQLDIVTKPGEARMVATTSTTTSTTTSFFLLLS